MDREFLDKLLEQISVSGCEECGQEVVKSHMQPFSDEIWTDEMGDVICILNPESPVRVMLSAHADEIGLLVTRITEEGRRRLAFYRKEWDEFKAAADEILVGGEQDEQE